MRELTSTEMLSVSGGGWFGELADWARSTFMQIFGSNTRENPPTIPKGTYDNFINACYRAGGTSAITYTSAGGSMNAVRIANADGTYNTVSLVCNKP